MDSTSNETRLRKIIFPVAFENQEAVQRAGKRFVHYTRADAAMNIIKSHEVWMRKSSCMNDFMEVEHGLRCVIAAYKSDDIGNRFKLGLDNVFDGLRVEVETLFDSWIPHFQTHTYFSCFSEHDDEEDIFGRLSMWRAYSATTGVALVVNPAPFFGASGKLKVYASPVAYLSDRAFQEKFFEVAKGIEENAEFLRSLGRDAVKAHIFAMLKFAVLCTKHPGFREEREWRIVYSPTQETSELLVKDIQVIAGTPQPIFKIPLKDIPEDGVIGIELSKFLNRIIIGPTQYPAAMREAFIELLAAANVEHPESKVFISDIPLRC